MADNKGAVALGGPAPVSGVPTDQQKAEAVKAIEESRAAYNTGAAEFRTRLNTEELKVRWDGISLKVQANATTEAEIARATGASMGNPEHVRIAVLLDMLAAFLFGKGPDGTQTTEGQSLELDYIERTQAKLAEEMEGIIPEIEAVLAARRQAALAGGNLSPNDLMAMLAENGIQAQVVDASNIPPGLRKG